MMRRMACLLVVLILAVCLPSAWAAKGKMGLATFSQMTTKKAAPKPRMMSAAFFRKKANQLIICGGGLETLNPQGDLWVLDLKTKEWSQIKPTNGDLKKVAVLVGIYDEKRDRLVVVAQKLSGKLEMFWYGFAKNKWNNVALVGEYPKVMFKTTPIYDPKSDSMVVFGGSAWKNPDNTHYRTVYYRDLYSLSLKDLKWKKLVTKGESPLPRIRQVEVYNSKTHSLVMFGGIGTDKSGNEVVFNDVWVLDLTKLQWKKVEAKGMKVEPRCSHCGVYDPIHNRMIVFGGAGMMGKRFSDLLALDLDTYIWSRVRTKLPITLQLSDAAAVWDSNANRMLVFGGIQPGRLMMNAVWELVQK